MANFERAINEMNLEAYAALLHGDFEFVFAPRDRHRVAPDTSWNRAEELMSMERLFSGEPGTNRFGRRVPGVKGIEFALVAADDWSYASAELETWDRTYHAFAKIFFEDGTRRVITRQQTFTLTAHRNEWDLSPVEFRLLRWEEVGCDCPTGGPTGGPPLMAKSRY